MIENQVNLKKAILQKEVHHTLKKKKKKALDSCVDLDHRECSFKD